jgi:hypothetical protein
VRRLIELRRGLGDGFELLDADDGVLAFRRGVHRIAANTTSAEQPAPFAGEPSLESEPGAFRDGRLAAHAAVVAQD